MIGKIEKAVREAQLRFPEQEIMGAIVNPFDKNEIVIFKDLTEIEYGDEIVLTRVRSKRI